MKSTRILRALFLLLPGLLMLLLAEKLPAREPDPVALQALSEAFRTRLEARRSPLFHELLMNESPGAHFLNEHPDVQLMAIDKGGHPVYLGVDNAQAAHTIRTDSIWPGGGAGFVLDGSGSPYGALGLWDAGDVLQTHQEFDTRVGQPDLTGNLHSHSTNVAGTMVSAGAYTAESMGMAFAAGLKAYDWTDAETEMTLGVGSHGLRVSNHSYSFITGWWVGTGEEGWGHYWFGDSLVSYAEEYRFGYYNEYAQDWDEIAHQAQVYTIFKSAANDRDDWGPADNSNYYVWSPTLDEWVLRTDSAAHDGDGVTDGGYDTITPIGTAKNIVTVGAVDIIHGEYTGPGDVVMMGYSSWGPTDDGRIKPDIVACGDSLMTPTTPDNDSYNPNFGGTSAASPSAAASAFLLAQMFKGYRGHDPLSATVKGLLIQSADEAGPDDGPDYMFGWGLMNSVAAARLLRADSLAQGYLVEQDLVHGETDVFDFCHDGQSPIKVALAWTDPEAAVPTAALDDPNPLLVNDLDLRLVHLDSGTTYRPWILDPFNPTTAAFTGDNIRDNVEVVELSSPPAGDYRLTVAHKASLAYPQTYAIVSSERLSPWVDNSDDIDNPQRSIGVAWGDYDGDGFEDLYLTNSADLNRLYHNEGDGSFTDDTISTPLDSGNNARSVNWIDIDKDGDLDLYLVKWMDPNRLFYNDGNGNLYEAGARGLDDSSISEASCWVDYDLDGDLDLYLVKAGSNRLFRNNGVSFTDVAATAGVDDGGQGRGATWADYDDDGDPDLYLANCGANVLYENLGNGTFAAVAGAPLSASGECSMGAVWGDYDGDLDLDLFVTNYFDDACRLFRNDGGGNFTDVTTPTLAQPGDWTSSAWLDFDNDGDLDIYVGRDDWNGDFAPNKLYENMGGVFRDISGPLAGESAETYGLAATDFDRDGLLDITMANWLDRNVLLKGDHCDAGAWLQVRLRGSYSDTWGIGARIRVVANNGQQQIREITAGEGYCSQGSLMPHFGLGEATRADTVEVAWPSGIVQFKVNVALGHRTLFNEDDGAGQVKMVANGDFETGDTQDWNENKGWNTGHPEPQIAVADVNGQSNALHVTRATDSDGSHAIVEQSIDQVLAGGDLSLSFKVLVNSHNFDNYGSWNAYPANVWVDYEDSTGTAFTYRRSFYLTVGSGVPDSESEQLTAGMWADRAYDLSSLVPPVAKVIKVRAGAQGWSYDVAFDDIDLDWQPLITNAPQDPADDTPAPSQLLGNYPNPFNPSTTIVFELARAGRATLAIFDVSGRRLRVLLDGRQEAGRREVFWDGRNDGGRAMASGVYFARLGTEHGDQARRLMLLK